MKRIYALFFFLFLISNLVKGATVYYSKPTGNLNATSTWTTTSGVSPSNFTSANCTYILNRAVVTFGGNWTVSGANSIVQVGDGTTATSFTISSGTVKVPFSIAGTSTTTISGGTLTTSTISIPGAGCFINSTTSYPSFGTLSSTSTVNYSGAAQTITNTSYGNLVLSGAGTKTLGTTANTSVAGILNISTGISFNINASTTTTLSLNGTVTGSGTFVGGTSSNLSIGGTGSFGTLTFLGTTTVNNFAISRSGSGTITMGSSLTVGGTFNHTNGVLDLGTNMLSLTGTATFPSAAGTGSISGTATSTLSITAGTISNSIYMASGSQIGTLILNSTGNTLSLGNNLYVSTVYTQTRGNVNLNGNTLTLSGAVTFTRRANRGTTKGSSTSGLIINSASSITNSLFMTTGSEHLGTLTMNSPAKTLTLGTKLTVGGTYTQTKGIISLNGQILTLSGTVVFPTSSANGTTTGTTASTLSVTATSITNPIAFTVGSQTLSALTLNSPSQTLTLGSALTLSGVFTHTAGKLAINGQLYTLDGNIVFPSTATNGSFTGSLSSRFTIGGTGTITNSFFMDQTSSSTKSLSNLTMNRTGRTITLGNTLNIIDSISPTLGTVAAGGNLVLIADQSTVGHVGRIGKVGGSVTGNVTSQIYHAPNTNTTDWRLMGVAGITGVNFSQWNAVSTGGIGTIPMTCPTCPYTSVAGVAFSSITTYSESTETYPDITYSSSMTPGVGYWIYMGSSSPGATSSPFLVSVSGAAKTGNVTVPLTSASTGTMKGYNLIANPYASPISFAKLKVVNPSINNSWWTYSPIYGDNAGYVGGISTPSYSHGGTGVDGTIPAGMGFFVHVNSATTFSFNETVKTNGSNETLLRTESTTSNLTFFRMQINDGANMMNEAVVRLDAGATTGLDPDYDLPDMPPAAWGWLQIATSSLGEFYAVNSLPDNQSSYSIPVKITSGTTGTYQLNSVDLQNMPSGACISLHDNYTNITHDLRSGPFNLTINDSETVARFTLNININNNITITSAYQAPSCPKANNGFIIANAGAGAYNYYWKDSTNNIVKTDLNHTGTDTLFNVGVGQYLVNAGVSGTCNNGTQSITIQASNYVASSFISSSQHDSLVGDTSVDVSFTNNSTNATQFFWVFGDGQTDSISNPTHTYTYADAFNVTLYAINAVCGDTAIYTETVIIDSLISPNEATTGIVRINTNNNMRISRDAQGYYVEFNYQNPTNATISVQNILGQKIVSDVQQLSVTKTKRYIDLGTTDNNILIISVINSRGEKAVQRVINQ